MNARAALPALIPEPRTVTRMDGFWTVPRRPVVACADPILATTASEACRLIKSSRERKAGETNAGDITIELAAHGSSHGSASEGRMRLRHAGEYSLLVSQSGVRVVGVDAAAVFYGLQTLRQLLEQSGPRVPSLTIHDWPDIPNRGVYYDVCRGRVPNRERLLELADLLSRHKINHLQLYIEHTFRFSKHQAIWRNASPLTPGDILALDARCRELHIELVPSLACLGHLATVLKRRRYRHLAEDWGIGRYVDPAYDKLPAWQKRNAWSLAPANPQVYEFLDSLFAEFLPLFSSDHFNVCCDETWDLGMGQSYGMCQKKGKGRLYLYHLMKLRSLAAKYGKRIMFWGDIIRHYPELIPEIPDDVTVLDWGYSSNHPFARIADFRKAGLPFYACPGTSSWVSLFPRLHESSANISGFAEAAKKTGASGLLNTDWGDGGHYNFMEFSWYGYLFGAEHGWNCRADTATFASRFCRSFLHADDEELFKAVRSLGDVAHLSVAGRYQAVWQHIFFASPDDDIFTNVVRRGSKCVNGNIRDNVTVRLDAALGRKTIDTLRRVRGVLVAASRLPNADPHKILPYWIFAVDTISHAAARLTVLAQGGRDTPKARLVLLKEMRGLRRRFKSLWLARNRPSEIRTTLARYDKTMARLKIQP